MRRGDKSWGGGGGGGVEVREKAAGCIGKLHCGLVLVSKECVCGGWWKTHTSPD